MDKELSTARVTVEPALPSGIPTAMDAPSCEDLRETSSYHDPGFSFQSNNGTCYKKCVSECLKKPDYEGCVAIVSGKLSTISHFNLSSSSR